MHDVMISYETVPCNFCGSIDQRTIYPAARRETTDLAQEFRSSGDEPLRDQLVACTRCGLQYVNPRLNPDLILAGYREGADEQFVSQAGARERTFARSLGIIEAHARGRGALLDVGTAAATFMHVAKERGWEVAGCEPNLWLCEWGRARYGFDIQAGTVFDHPYRERSFDVVTVWDVLEHAPDPMRLLRECHRILKPSGLLVVSYPDIGSLAARVMGRRWVFLLSVHLYYFTRRTMSAMLERAGFEVVEMRRHIQQLELDYILGRAESAAGPLARAVRQLVARLGLASREVPYWMGQTLVVARRRPAPDPAVAYF
jgi:SAM-dependent methyltransferase